MLKRIIIPILVFAALIIGFLGYKYFLPQRSVSEEEKIMNDLKVNMDCGDGGKMCFVTNVVGEFAKGNMKMAYWMAQKTNGKWKVVITGNGIPSCNEIDKFKVPTEIYGNCIESSGELRNK
jgi:hypothetical protein